MKRNVGRLCGLAAVLLAVGGCADPFEGNWKRSDDCGKSEFSALGDGTGDGDVWMSNYYGDCTICTFQFDWEARGNQEYRIDLTFDTCHCDGVKTGRSDCVLNSDGNRADCDLSIGSCTFPETEWKKVE